MDPETVLAAQEIENILGQYDFLDPEETTNADDAGDAGYGEDDDADSENYTSCIHMPAIDDDAEEDTKYGEARESVKTVANESGAVATPVADSKEKKRKRTEKKREVKTVPTESPFACASCHKKFKQSRYLADHIKYKKCSMQPRIGYQCLRCGASGGEDGDGAVWLGRHELEAHGDNLFKHYVAF